MPRTQHSPGREGDSGLRPESTAHDRDGAEHCPQQFGQRVHQAVLPHREV